MRESFLTQPPGTWFIRKWDWAITATERNEPAAELISVFLFHYENRTTNRILVELVQRAITKHQVYLREMGDWMPYSNAYLRECLLNTHGQNQVIAGLECLERLNFISTDVPDAVKEFYSKSHTWIKLEIENIQNWIDTVWIPANPRAQVYSVKHAEVKAAVEQVTGFTAAPAEPEPPAEPVPLVQKEEAETHPKLNTFTKQVDAICAFDKHIHDRNNNFVYDKERRDMIKARLKERKDWAYLALASIGITFSDWHMGRHPGNTIGIRNDRGEMGRPYHDVKHIFRNSSKLENAIRHAELSEVSLSRARTELIAFLEGTPSRYSLKHREDAEPIREEKEAAAELEKRKPYLSFAHSIVRYFLSETSNAEILEICESNTKLEAMGRELIEPEMLFDALVTAAKSFKPTGIPDDVKVQMKTFAQDYCQIQEMNL